MPLSKEQISMSCGEPIRQGRELRYMQCPNCDKPRSQYPFAYNEDTGEYYCHAPECCTGGIVSDYSSSIALCSNKLSMPKPQVNVEDYCDDCFPCHHGTVTSRYLSSRGIKVETLNSLDANILEHQYKGYCIYPFLNKDGELVALQRTYFDCSDSFHSKHRRYLGKKKHGVAILKSGTKMIVAEGLETGLSVLQFLGDEYGLMICGDANGMRSLGTHNKWACSDTKKLILAIDNDTNNTGANVARFLINELGTKVLAYMPSLCGSDWNDVLLNNNFKEEWI